MIGAMAREETARHAEQHGARKVFGDEAGRWLAIVDRDRTADGRFFYSVRTTGVYCRPSCPSRRARREHVRFHRTTAEAERAGFRPCKRCRPDEPALSERRAAVVESACRAIERAAHPLTLRTLAETTGMSRFHFHRVFTSLTGVSPRQYAVAHRTRRVRDGLAQRSTVTEVMYGAGFNSSGRFYANASGTLGMTPTRFRAGGAGTVMQFAVGQCWLGAVLVAATETGVCAIFLGDDPDTLLRELQDRFPKAQLVGGDREFEGYIARVIGLVEAPGLGLDLPFDIRGTAFQQRVWQALRDIPAGTTASYTDIAHRIGAPKAVRGVAGACAANPIAVAIPCHRVVRRDGALAGYRWGVERKRALLKREAIR
jgi:AraC family transcriptional regulator of adaptative response/methylated-DNA-[protein]-cysteine methyltransferase